MYISEWASGNWDLSNIRVTTKVAVNSLLGDTPTLVEYGSAIMHNLGTREVKAAVRILVFVHFLILIYMQKNQTGHPYVMLDLFTNSATADKITTNSQYLEN